MKLNILSSAAILLLGLTALGSCSSDDSSDANNVVTNTQGDVQTAPAWQMDWTNNQARPDWKQPQATDYESGTILYVEIDEELKPYASSDDMMAVFVGGELRGVEAPAILIDGEDSNHTAFLIMAFGIDSGNQTLNVTLKYYNSRLQHIFTCETSFEVNSDEIPGIDYELDTEFMNGSAKYPVVTDYITTGILTKAGITPTTGDVMAAFVGDECRGVEAMPSAAMTIYGRQAGETVTLKYYDAVNKRIITFGEKPKVE